MLAVGPKCFWPKQGKRCMFGARRTRFCCCDQTRCLSTKSQRLWIQNSVGRQAKRFSRRMSNNIKTILRLDFLSGAQTPFCRGTKKRRESGLHVRKKCGIKNRGTRPWKISMSIQNWCENETRWWTGTGKKRAKKKRAEVIIHSPLPPRLSSHRLCQWNLRGHCFENYIIPRPSALIHILLAEKHLPRLTLTCLNKIKPFTPTLFNLSGQYWKKNEDEKKKKTCHQDPWNDNEVEVYFWETLKTDTPVCLRTKYTANSLLNWAK